MLLRTFVSGYKFYLLGVVAALVTSRASSFCHTPLAFSYWSRSPHFTVTSSSVVHSLDDKTMAGLMDVAIDASKKAGQVIRQHYSGIKVQQRKANSRDLLTLIDSLCEKTIYDVIAHAYPHHSFIGEESVPPGKEASMAAITRILHDSSQSDFLWIVDPIDGTTNFVHGMPLSVPSIAVAYKGEVVAGVIFDPHRNELFTAIKGKGAYMNGQIIQVGFQNELAESVIGMGSPPAEDSISMSLKGAEALMFVVHSLRMLGSAALMLAWVACGRLTCYWEFDLSCWDVCAGALLVEEAGGHVSDLGGKEFSLTSRKICATNKKIHRKVLMTLNNAGIE